MGNASAIFLRKTALAALAYLLFLTFLFLLVTQLPQLPYVQVSPPFSETSAVPLLVQYVTFLDNILHLQWGVSRIDLSDADVFGFVLTRLLRSLTLFVLALLVAVPLGRFLGDNLNARTGFKILTVGIVSFFVPALLFLWLWLLNDTLGLVPSYGFFDRLMWQRNAEVSPETVSAQLIGAAALGLLLSGCVLALLRLTPRRRKRGAWALGLGVFLIGLVGFLWLFDSPRPLLRDLLAHALLPWATLATVMTGAYALFVCSPLLRPPTRALGRWEPGWSLFVAVAVSAQIYIEAELRWEGLGQAFMKLFFVLIDWQLMLGALMAIGLWVVLVHWGRGLYLALGVPTRPPDTVPTPASPDAKSWFVARFLLTALLALLLAHPLLLGMISFNPIPARLLESTTATLLFGAAAGVVALGLAATGRGLLWIFGRIHADWLGQWLCAFSKGLLALPWIALVMVVFYLSIRPFAVYPLYGLALGVGVILWPIPFFMFDRARPWRSLWAAFFLTAGLAVALEPMVSLGGWHPNPNTTWGELINRGFVNALVRMDVRNLFWITSLAISFVTFTLYLFALELKSREPLPQDKDTS